MTIGGELEIDPATLPAATSDEASAALPVALAGRTALHLVLWRALEERRDATIHLPEYACESMVLAAEATDAPVHFYPVDESLQASVDAAFPPGAIVVLVSYFGLADVRATAARLRRDVADVHLVRDAVHAPWDVEDLAGTDVAFTSWRKAYAVPDGAPIHPPFAWPVSPSELGSAIAHQRLAAGLLKHSKRHAPLDDSTYLQIYKSAEEHLDQRAALTAHSTGLSAQMMTRFDLPEIAARRRRNFERLQALLAPQGLPPLVPLAANAVPLFYPVRIDDRDAVRTRLAARGIYCPAHWPRPARIAEASAAATALYEQELSLVVDQRYDDADMTTQAAALLAARSAT